MKVPAKRRIIRCIFMDSTICLTHTEPATGKKLQATVLKPGGGQRDLWTKTFNPKNGVEMGNLRKVLIGSGLGR